jgi:hypothetical protein
MTDLERFLRLATWSLWGAQKRTVRMELESHIAHKTWKYQMLGFSESEALQKALIDLGQPHVISAGMTGVYTMPTLFRNTILVGLLLSLGLATLQSSAQVDATNRLPIAPCLESTNSVVRSGEDSFLCDHPYTFFLSLEQLKTDLEPKGVKFENTDPKNLYLNFPQGKPVSVTRSDYSYEFDNKKFELSKEFVEASYFLTDDLPKSELPVTLSGWDKIVVGVGKTQFDISFLPLKPDPKIQYSPPLAPQPEILYGNIILESISGIFNEIKMPYYVIGTDERKVESVTFRVMDKKYRNQIQFNVDPNRIYVLIRAGTDSRLTISSRILHLDTNNFNAIGLQKKLEFVDSWDKLIPMKLDASNPQRSGTAILARVNTTLNDKSKILEIVNPNQIQTIGEPERLIANDTTQTDFCKDKGGANTSMAGRWSGEFQSMSPGKSFVGKLDLEVQPNGVFEGELERPNPVLAKGISLGAFCKNNQFAESYEMWFHDSFTTRVPLNTGSIKQISPTLIEGSSIERDRKDKIVGQRYFRLRKQ